MERDGRVAEVITEFLRVIISRNDDGNLVVFDELEFLGSSSVVKEEGEFWVAGRVLEIAEDIFSVPAVFFLKVVFVEIGLDGGSGERVGGVQIQNLVSDIGGLGKVALG